MPKFEALFAGLDWRRVRAVETRAPEAIADDIAVLKAMLIAATAREVRKDGRIERLERLVAAFKQAAFGRRSEKADPDQFDLALEDLETAIAAVKAEEEADTSPQSREEPALSV